MSGGPRVWRAQAQDAEDVARLLIAFRDWFEGDAPSEAAMRDSVSALIADPDTEFLLAATAPATAPAGVCQLRFRHSVWMSCDDCWLEDLFVEETARGKGLGRALVLAEARLRDPVRQLDAGRFGAGSQLSRSAGGQVSGRLHSRGGEVRRGPGPSPQLA